jgi:hypothetical protein
MVVSVAGTRLFFHAGCKPSITEKPDLVDDWIGMASDR